MKTIYCIFLFLLTGCSSAYIPSPKSVPLFEQKGDALIEVGTSTNSPFLVGSYAFSEKYAVIANGSISYPALAGNPIREYNELTFFLDGDVPHYSFEAGLGRYNLLPSSKRRLEVFAGAGYGMAFDHFNKDYKQNYIQGFVQINTGKRYKAVDVGWSLRTAYADFQNKNGYYKNNEYITDYQNCQAFHFEPLFVVRIGGQHLKWFSRAGFNLAFPLSSNSFIETFGVNRGYTMFHISTGMSYRFK